LPMKPRPNLLALALFVCVVTGCAKDPRLKLAQAEHTLAVIELRLVEEAKAGNISPKEVLLIDPAIQAARASLDDADARLTEGKIDIFDADLRMFGAIAKRLVDVYLPAPATQPSQ
jgi:hypothetical protein